MKVYRLAAVVLTLGLLTGCASLLERSYTASEPHSSKFWESEAAATLRAENRQDMVNDLLILISQHTETASLRLYNFPDEQTALEELEKAVQEVQQETPLGAYAVEYITYISQAFSGIRRGHFHRDYFGLHRHCRYRRCWRSGRYRRAVRSPAVHHVGDVGDGGHPDHHGADRPISVRLAVQEDRQTAGYRRRQAHHLRSALPSGPYQISSPRISFVFIACPPTCTRVFRQALEI